MEAQTSDWALVPEELVLYCPTGGKWQCNSFSTVKILNFLRRVFNSIFFFFFFFFFIIQFYVPFKIISAHMRWANQ